MRRNREESKEREKDGERAAQRVIYAELEAERLSY